MRDFIKALGGAPAIASEISRLSGERLKTNAVYQWTYEDNIPQRWRPYVVRMARDRSVAVPQDLEAQVERVVRMVTDIPPSDATEAAE